ncbi:serine protease snake isoform X1 [Nasonia vitripennis]|uniref:chymotrypsin n=2 Tax=Nasonia vitripennis TaxID=7425 RepID=A0A7M7HA42_NASVI|nr:serine protease snake isoform X1 [Nasonia vitripennis]
MRGMRRSSEDYLLLVAVVIVCTWTNATARTSQRKCKEYAELVTREEVAPVLRMGVQTNLVSECGIVETPLIVGGVKAKSNEFPHMVAVGFGKPPENSSSVDFEVSWECGGSIISENFVLTASHCLESKDRGPAIRIRAGSTLLKDPEPGYQERVVIERIKHPNYTLPARYNDIALLRLEKPLELSGAVRPACLEIEHEPVGKVAIASGFGKTAYDEAVGSNELMKVQLNYISKDDCERSYKIDIGGRQLPSGLIPSLLCAGVMEGGKDTCQGDSGGPLQRVLSEPYCMYSLVGVTSFGKFCAFENSPAMYSRVSSYVDWIESVVWPGEL